MARALDVAKLFLAWANEHGDVLTNLKIQKLLYYAQAWYLVNYNQPLFSDAIEAWDFGPVVRTLYGRWKKHGAAPIPYKSNGKEEAVFSDQEVEFLRDYFRIFSSLSATALVSMSHSEDPWKNAYVPKGRVVINPNNIRTYYKKQYRERYAKKRRA